MKCQPAPSRAKASAYRPTTIGCSATVSFCWTTQNVERAEAVSPSDVDDRIEHQVAGSWRVVEGGETTAVGGEPPGDAAGAGDAHETAPAKQRAHTIEVTGVDQFAVPLQQFGDGQPVREAHADLTLHYRQPRIARHVQGRRRRACGDQMCSERRDHRPVVGAQPRLGHPQRQTGRGATLFGELAQP